MKTTIDRDCFEWELGKRGKGESYDGNWVRTRNFRSLFLISTFPFQDSSVFVFCAEWSSATTRKGGATMEQIRFQFFNTACWHFIINRNDCEVIKLMATENVPNEYSFLESLSLNHSINVLLHFFWKNCRAFLEKYASKNRFFTHSKIEYYKKTLFIWKKTTKWTSVSSKTVPPKTGSVHWCDPFRT